MTKKNLVALLLLAVLAVTPLFNPGNYALHLMVMALLWSYIYTSWSIMGRLGLVSFGHGAFLGIGAYTVVLLWNLAGMSPWLGALVALAITLVVAFLIGLPCFRFKIVGHYFALVTLALSEVTRLIIVGLRDSTGGSLGLTPKPALTDGATSSLWAMQFSNKAVWFYIVLLCWLAALWIWHRVDRGMNRLALEAISEEEDAAASIGINVTRAKLTVTLLSATMTCIGGVLYAQYQLYINPETVSGIGISLQMVFGVIAGGLFVMLGPHHGRGVPAAAQRVAAGADRQPGAGGGHHHLRAAAGAVHHLHAQGHRRHAAAVAATSATARAEPLGRAARSGRRFRASSSAPTRRTSISNASSRMGGAHTCQVRPSPVSPAGAKWRGQQGMDVVHGVHLGRGEPGPVTTQTLGARAHGVQHIRGLGRHAAGRQVAPRHDGAAGKGWSSRHSPLPATTKSAGAGVAAPAAWGTV